jgi:hypothetical protein
MTAENLIKSDSLPGKQENLACGLLPYNPFEFNINSEYSVFSWQ